MQRIRELIVSNMWWMVLLTAAALLVVHSFGVHRIVVDNTSLVLLALVLFSPFVAAVKKIKIGDFEAEIEPKEVKRIAQQVEQVLPDSVSENAMEPEANGATFAIKALAKSDPVVALAKLRIELESRLRRLLSMVNQGESNRKSDPLNLVIKQLTVADLFVPEFGTALRGIIAICNRAIHGEDIRDVDALQIVNTGVELLEALDQMVREYGVAHPIETTVISPDEREDFQRGLYRLTTIVPLVEKPERHVYMLTQEELDSFFDGYSEYAEFVVALERLK